jgi:predicted double-glycine peptidase
MNSGLRVAARYIAAQVTLPVPTVPQSTDFSCGSACLMAVMRFWLGEELKVERENELWSMLQTDPETGVEPERMAAAARAFGLSAEHRLGMTVEDLRRQLQMGHTVILMVQAWQTEPVPWAQDWDHAHYVVLVGMDASNAYFMDPAPEAQALKLPQIPIPLAELPDRWHNPAVDGSPEYGFGLTVYKP